MAGFLSPSILMLNTWDGPERTYSAGVLEKLLKAGYNRYEEPAVGGFAMPLVAVGAGWSPQAMTTSDVHLYSSVLGELCAGRGMDALDVRLDGQLIATPGSPPARQAAEVIWGQYLARIAPKTGTYYWSQLLSSISNASRDYVEALETQLTLLAERLAGLEYQHESLWDHLDRVADDPKAVIISNPPTYPGAYETFFDTDGAVTWDAPDYEVFDAPVDIPRMVEMMEGRAALLIVQQQQAPGRSAHPAPTYARQLSAGQLVFMNSNRPDEVKSLTAGIRVTNRRMPAHAPRRWPSLPDDYVITDDAVIATQPVDSATAEAYRGQWMHRISSAPGGMNVLLTIDGYAAGIIGYSTSTIVGGYAVKWAKYMILRFAFGSPHKTLRITRLATMVALMKETAWKVASPKSSLAVGSAIGLVTVEMTRHPEAKGLRQLMTLADRQSHPDGYKLVYIAEWIADATLASTLTTFRKGESTWQAARSKK
jgi:hypothetical protein